MEKKAPQARVTGRQLDNIFECCDLRFARF
jgi:hypothetical protein